LKEKKVSKHRRPTKSKDEEIFPILESVPLLPSQTVVSTKDQLLVSLSPDEGIILSQKHTRLSNLIAKHIGADYISKSEKIKISKIMSGLFFSFQTHLIGNWKQIREDGVETIIKLVKKNGVLEDHFWLIMKLDQPNESFNY
jgi:hypothetical protein